RVGRLRLLRAEVAERAECDAGRLVELVLVGRRRVGRLLLLLVERAARALERLDRVVGPAPHLRGLRVLAERDLVARLREPVRRDLAADRLDERALAVADLRVEARPLGRDLVTDRLDGALDLLLYGLRLLRARGAR